MSNTALAAETFKSEDAFMNFLHEQLSLLKVAKAISQAKGKYLKNTLMRERKIIFSAKVDKFVTRGFSVFHGVTAFSYTAKYREKRSNIFIERNILVYLKDKEDVNLFLKLQKSNKRFDVECTGGFKETNREIDTPISSNISTGKSATEGKRTPVMFQDCRII